MQLQTEDYYFEFHFIFQWQMKCCLFIRYFIYIYSVLQQEYIVSIRNHETPKYVQYYSKIEQFIVMLTEYLKKKYNTFKIIVDMDCC